MPAQGSDAGQDSPDWVASVLTCVGTPLVFGSASAVVLGLITAILMVVRTALEDRTLLAELDGYRAYAARVRYRLLPGVW